MFFLEQERSRPHYTPFFSSDFAPSQIGRIVISEKDSLVVLNQVDQEWFITMDTTHSFIGFPVEQEQIDTLFTRSRRIHNRNHIAASSEARTRLGVTEETGKTVRTYDMKGAPLHTFYIGRPGEVWANSYFRMSGEDDIYSVGENIRFAYGANLDRWREDRLFTFTPEEITHVGVTHRDESYFHITKQDDSRWKLDVSDDDPITRDSTLVRRFLLYLSEAEAGQWSYEAEHLEVGTTPPLMDISIELASGKVHRLTVVEQLPDSLRYRALSSTFDSPFYLFNSRIQFMNREMRRIRNPEKTEELDAESPIKDLKERLGY
ncbi:DUF4340 domain-containing protein [Chitinivibrio alkaliphilus]|uniref:DUF4340 domain-containing protein n=1 Tax=Chitinivibrio alkaliphilus ACht1 TaxID=1313304 RepID=U7D4I4_9BACT|nr:DUF4340 domain-containing protein [Chitinivibrio alkaliphilus]ERP31419.1 hypothetical protein CALK_1617 [Chitinivibrio alkaliphilus ACht1]